MEVLITGSSGYIGRQLKLKGERPTHQELDLTKEYSCWNYKWDGDIIIHCANSGTFKNSTELDLKHNLMMMFNLKNRWPKAKIITFGSGAMFDKRYPIIKAKETDIAYPIDYYGMAKRLLLGIPDVTLVMFGVYGDTGFVKECRTGKVTIYQDVKFSWTKEENINKYVEWALDKKGVYNICEFDMTLTEVANKEKAEITYLHEGMGNEYTGQITIR